MVNQKIVIEIASVVYAIATYLILKDNLTKMLPSEKTNDTSEDDDEKE